MADYIYTNGKLYNTNELKHWRYVKREKVNGKWKYYYDLSALKSDIRTAKNNIVSKVRDVVGYDEQDRYAKSIEEVNTSNAALAKAQSAEKKGVDRTTENKLAEEYRAEYEKSVKVDPVTNQLTMSKKAHDLESKALAESHKNDEKERELKQRRQEAEKNVSDKKSKAEQAKTEYDKTLLGRVDSAKSLWQKSDFKKGIDSVKLTGEARIEDAKKIWDQSDFKKEIDRIKKNLKSKKSGG